ncbi:MAG: GspH/FimT family pseudopilin [Gammaproteobacteria bacterium]|nr:GspH/FimT family pseudopilin [Gammaproteobacteria bacterium]MDH5799600.1 GspH/FimT family pseudopilin [Gammaproteobacteria bacterium]
MKFSKQSSGFTLIELLVALAIVAIVASQAVPNFRVMIQNNKLIAQKNEFITTINLARSEAVKRGNRITVCASSNQSSCNSTDWSQGWIVFSDIDADTVLDSGTGACLDTEDCLLRVGSGTADIKLLSSGFAHNGYIQYLSRGTVDSAGTFTFCDSRGNSSARATNINSMGRIISAQDANDDGIVDDLAGNNVVCTL